MNKEEYLLLVLAEECGELAKRASKAIRFGAENYSPVSGKRNYDALIEEFNDILAAAEQLNEIGYSLVRRERLVSKKKDKVEHYWREYDARKNG